MEVTKLQKNENKLCEGGHDFPVAAEYAIREKGLVSYACEDHENAAVRTRKQIARLQRGVENITGVKF